jgi:hypothetical protein
MYVPGAKLMVKVSVVEGGNRFEHTSAPGQSGLGPLLSTSTKNLWTAPSPLDSWIVTVSPCVTVIVGFGTLVLFQAVMKPIRLIVGVEAAATLGSMFIDVIPIALIDRMPMMKIESRRSSIRSYYTDKSL